MSPKTLFWALFATLALCLGGAALLAQSPPLRVVALGSGINDVGNFVTTIDSNRVYICTQGGRILKTVDGGETWIEKSLSPNVPLRSMSFPSSSRGYAVGDGGVFRTVDSGATWQNVYSGYLLSVAFVSETVGFVAGHLPHGILKTTNGGNSWTPVYPGSPVHKVYFVNDNLGFAVPFLPATDTILRTVDAGATWSKVVIPEFTNSYGATAFSFTDDSTGFLAEWEKGIYKSTDAGASWHPVPLDIPGHWYSRSLQFLNSMQGFVVGLNDSTGVIIRTEDGGNHWSVIHVHDSAGVTYTGIGMASSKKGFVSSVGMILRIEEGNQEDIEEDSVSNPVDTVEVITALTEVSSRARVYPNPTFGEIQLERYEGVEDIVITDMMGREIQRIKPNESVTRLFINDPGLYIIRLDGPRIRQRLKVVVVR